MAKPSPDSAARPRLLVLELWGLGDLALAIPFLRTAVQHSDVTLLAKPHAGPLLRRFAPEVCLVSATVPWTAFRGKYRLHRWPWRELFRIRGDLRQRHFDLGVSARLDPRDHVLLAVFGARRRFGFPRTGSRFFLTDQVGRPTKLHRAEHWRTLAERLGWEIDSSSATPPSRKIGPQRILIHTGAGQPVRQWPSDRYEQIVANLRTAGHDVRIVDDSIGEVDRLIETLTWADRFIGNDSGPGHLAALLGIPTFTVFGPQLPQLFAPIHPLAAWVEGAPCRYKPCFDACHFAQAYCLTNLHVDTVAAAISSWLQ